MLRLCLEAAKACCDWSDACPTCRVQPPTDCHRSSHATAFFPAIDAPWDQQRSWTAITFFPPSIDHSITRDDQQEERKRSTGLSHNLHTTYGAISMNRSPHLGSCSPVKFNPADMNDNLFRSPRPASFESVRIDVTRPMSSCAMQ